MKRRKSRYNLLFDFLLTFIFLLRDVSSVHLPPLPTYTESKPVVVKKCCALNEVMNHGLEHNGCVNISQVNVTAWSPIFTNDYANDDGNLNPSYNVEIGVPECKNRQRFPIYHYIQSNDQLILLPNGKLRHFVFRNAHDKMHYDYEPGMYCIDNIILEDEPKNATFAVICAPDLESPWQHPDYLMRRLIDPICHVLSLFLLTLVVAVYLALPPLNDLVGNIIASICSCLILAQFAGLVRIFGEFNSEMSFFIADAVIYISTVAAFFWLNSFGFYIWKTFGSRNVSLRSTDCRKYFYYSMYVWCMTGCLSAMALFAHFFLDVGAYRRDLPYYEEENFDEFEVTSLPVSDGNVGPLGVSIFLIPIAFTILANIFFYISTREATKRICSYGRIHHKLKQSFHLFSKLFAIMTVNWLVWLLAHLPVRELAYIAMFSNLVHSFLIAYFTVASIKRVRYLAQKSCCSITFCHSKVDNTEDGMPEWGEEMMTPYR